MRIAQVAPLYESCPPQLYGGTERVVSYLTEQLVRQGHEVTLFASGDSKTKATLQAPCARALRLDTQCRDPLPYHFIALHRLAQSADEFDIIHFHTDYLHSAVCAALGQDADDAARPPRPTRPSAYVARICDDAAGVNLKYAAYARPLGKLVRHGLPWATVQSLCRRVWRRRLPRLHRSHLSGEATGLGNRNRASRRDAVDDRGKGRRGRSHLSRNQDQAATRGSAGRLRRRDRR